MLSKNFILNYLHESSDLDLFTCSQLRYYLTIKGFRCLAPSNMRKAELLKNAKYIFEKYGV